MFSQDRTDKKPARTDTFAESLHLVGRQERWRSGNLLGARVAPRPSMWRLEQTTRQPLQAPTRDLRDTGSGRYQPLRESLSAHTGDLVAILSPGDQHDTFQP